MQDEELRRNVTKRLNNKSNENSDEDNEVDEGTISGENDVEYAEFSVSLRTSPKEQINGNVIENATTNTTATTSTINTTESTTNANNFDDFMILPISVLPSNISRNFINL